MSGAAGGAMASGGGANAPAGSAMDGGEGVDNAARVLLAVRQPPAAQAGSSRDNRVDPYAALERQGDDSELETQDSDDERHASDGNSSPERNNLHKRRRLAEMDDDEDLAEFMSPPRRQARPARRAGGEGAAVAPARKRTDCGWRPVRCSPPTPTFVSHSHTHLPLPSPPSFHYGPPTQ